MIRILFLKKNKLTFNESTMHKHFYHSKINRKFFSEQIWSLLIHFEKNSMWVDLFQI